MEPTFNSFEKAAWWSRFKGLLDDQNTWPSKYLFKFIAPRSSLSAVEALFSPHSVVTRASSKGRYISVTAHILMSSSEEIVAVYHKAAKIEGVIAL